MIKTEEIFSILKEYASETTEFKRTFDYEIAKENLLEILHSTNQVLLFKEENGKLQAIAILSCFHQFVKEKFGSIDIFYIRPEYRGKGIARDLLQSCLDWFKTRKCDKIVTFSLGKIGKDQLFINLLKKYGFREEATVLIKDI